MTIRQEVCPMEKKITCPLCGGSFPVYANPAPTTDVVIFSEDGRIVLVKRRNEPHGFALPGGFVDEGEYVENAAIREMREETALSACLLGVLGVYSRPDRDPRRHTMTVVFAGVPRNPGALQAGDDAGSAFWCDPENLPSPMCFDHSGIITDFLAWRRGTRSLAPVSSDWLKTPEGSANTAFLETRACGGTSRPDC